MLVGSSVTGVTFLVLMIAGRLLLRRGVQPLVDHFAFTSVFVTDEVDATALLDAVEGAAGATAADALGAAIDGCAAETPVEPDTTDEDLVAAVTAVAEILGYPGGELLEEFDCSDIFEVFVVGSYGVAVLSTAEYQEPIRLSVQAPEPSTPTTPTTAPAAQGAQAARVTPTYTG